MADPLTLLGPRTETGNSPLTGYGRSAWVSLLANLTASFAEAADVTGSPARPWFPGADEARLIEGLEGFARMSVAWGAWLGQPANPMILEARGRRTDVLEIVTRGLEDGTRRDGDFFWGEFGDREQRIVEAAEIATALWLGRERLVPALGPERVRQVLGWLDGIHGKEVYDDNWWLFPVMVALTQRALGWSVEDRAIDRGIDWMVERYRGDGWYADGGGHAFDLYTGWAIHWHLMFWARIDGARRPRLAKLVERRYASWLKSMVHTIAPDGSRPLFGRSLGYRFAFAGPFSLAAVFGVDALPPGLARRAATSVIAHDVLAGAIDPATGWLLRGVGRERPDVCERYISRGAVAWAAHSLVALALPPEHSFWADDEQPLPSETSDGALPMRAAGYAIHWRASTAETVLMSGLADHPSDIPGHDYAPFYGKLVYRSAFPLSVRSAGGAPTPDGGLVVAFADSADTRRKVDAGGCGPSWVWTDYRLGQTSNRCALKTVLLTTADGVEIRVTSIDPRSPVQLTEAPAALGVDAESQIRRGTDPDGATWTTDGRRYVAVRPLLGYQHATSSAPTTDDGPDRNLIYDHAEQPAASESAPSRTFRVVATASCAVATGRPSLSGVRVDDASDPGSGRLVVWPSDREQVFVCVGSDGPASLVLGGHRFDGAAVRIVRAAADGSAFAGEPLSAIANVLTLEQTGPIAVERGFDAGRQTVELWTASGIALDSEWTGTDLRRLEMRSLSGWREVCLLDEPNVVPDGLVRKLQRANELTLLNLRLT